MQAGKYLLLTFSEIVINSKERANIVGIAFDKINATNKVLTKLSLNVNTVVHICDKILRQMIKKSNILQNKMKCKNLQLV